MDFKGKALSEEIIYLMSFIKKMINFEKETDLIMN